MQKVVERAYFHIGVVAERLVDDAGHGRLKDVATSFEMFDSHSRSHSDLEPLGESARHQEPLRRSRAQGEPRVARRTQHGVGAKACQHHPIAAVSCGNPHRNKAQPFRSQNPGKVSDFADRPIGDGLGKSDRGVSAFNETELNVDHVGKRVPPKKSHDHHRQSERQAKNCHARILAAG